MQLLIYLYKKENLSYGKLNEKKTPVALICFTVDIFLNVITYNIIKNILIFTYDNSFK